MVTIELPESRACQIHFSADASSGESVYCINVIADRTEFNIIPEDWFYYDVKQNEKNVFAVYLAWISSISCN